MYTFIDNEESINGVYIAPVGFNVKVHTNKSVETLSFEDIQKRLNDRLHSNNVYVIACQMTDQDRKKLTALITN